MIEVLFKASLAIGIALAFYKLVLQQESFFAVNRFYLLGCILLAFALPFITLPQLINHQGYLNSFIEKEVPSEGIKTSGGQETSSLTATVEYPPIETGNSETLSETSAANLIETASSFTTSEDIPKVAAPIEVQVQKTSYSFSFWLLMLYLFGVAIFFLSLLYQIGVVVFAIVTAKEKYRDENCIIVSTSKRQAPCSFFNYIFIYPDEYDFKTYEQIIAHEKIHVKLGHSLDMLLAELAIIVLWFNPLIWFFKKEIEKNNEYQTDATLLEEEHFLKESYQLNLLQIAVPNKPLNITTNYNQSLIKQRIIMMNSKKSTSSAYWKYTFLVPIFFGMLLLVNEPAVSQENKEASQASKKIETNSGLVQKTNEVVVQRINIDEEISKIVSEMQDEDVQRTPEPVREIVSGIREVSNSTREVTSTRKININIPDRTTDLTKGFWYSNRKGNEYCIQFRGSEDNNSTWNLGRCFNVNDFQKKGNATFVITKESGTMELTGNLNAEVGQGKYVFTPNPEFEGYLAGNNITSENENLVFHLFFGNVSKNYIEFLKQQYQEVNGDRLLELAIHGVSQDNFKNYIALFEKHSKKKPSIREVVEAKIHGIDEAYVQEIQRMGYTDLSLRKMMEAKIHNVSTSYVESLKHAGYTNLSMDKIISAKIHGVDPATIKEMKALGQGEMSIDKVIELQIHRVSADYIQQLESAGLTNLSLDQVVSAKIHGLNPASIQELRSLGYRNLSFNELLSARIHRVDLEYVKNLREAGLTNLSIDEVTTAKIHRLDPQSIKEIRALGFKDLSFDDLMSAQIHRVNAEYVRDLQKVGFSNLDINNVVSAKIHGIDSKFIENARKNGYNLNSINKYISLKIHGSAMESLKDN